MLIVDDILLSPFRGIIWIFRKIHEAAQEEIESRGERITTELRELYMQLEMGKISEEEFDAREKVLLDLLDEIEQSRKDQAEEE